MSLSRNQEENNYWPSISDMFLVFFVLTLALASTMIKGQQDGDKFVQDDVIAEAKLLVEFIHSTPDKDGKHVSILWPEIPKDHARQLAMAVRKSREWVMANKVGADTPNRPAIDKLIAEDEEADLPDPYDELEGTPGALAWSSMGRNIKAMYLALDLGKAEEVPDNLYYDKMLRAVNYELNRLAGNLTPQQEIDLLKDKLAKTEAENARLKKETNKKDKEIDELKKIIADLQRIVANLKKTVANQQGTIAAQGEKIDGLVKENERLVAVNKNARISTVVLGEKDVSFASGKHDVLTTFNQDSFNKLIEQIREKLNETDRKWVVEVIGHTDPNPLDNPERDKINALLGVQRAQFFQKKIEEKFTQEKHRLIFRPYSASYYQPIRKADGRTDDDASRRIEVIIRPE